MARSGRRPKNRGMMSGLIALGIKGSCWMRGGGGGCFETIKRQYIMSIKDEDKVFTSGDVVALKLSPEFRGVIQGLSAKVLNGCNNLPEQIVNCFGSPNDTGSEYQRLIRILKHKRLLLLFCI